MNEDTLKGKWKQLKGSIRAEWGRLTNDDLDEIRGDFEKLSGRVQELYGESRDEVKRALDRLEKSASLASSAQADSERSEQAPPPPQKRPSQQARQR